MCAVCFTGLQVVPALGVAGRAFVVARRMKRVVAEEPLAPPEESLVSPATAPVTETEADSAPSTHRSLTY